MDLGPGRATLFHLKSSAISAIVHVETRSYFGGFRVGSLTAKGDVALINRERPEQMITVTLALPDKLELHNLLQFARRLDAVKDCDRFVLDIRMAVPCKLVEKFSFRSSRERTTQASPLAIVKLPPCLESRLVM